MSDDTEQSPETRIRESGTRARKWLLGIVVAAVAAVITSYVTGGITSGVDRARGLVEDEPAPLTADVSRPFKRGSGHFVFTRPLGAVKALPLPTGELGDLEVWGAWAREHGGLESDKTGSRSSSRERHPSRSRWKESPSTSSNERPRPAASTSRRSEAAR